VILLDNRRGETHELLVSTSSGRLLEQETIAGVQPPIVPDEFLECEAAAKRHPDFQAAMRRRGITDFDLLMVDPWSAGNYGDPRESTQRLARTLTWIRPEPGANGFARPVEGVMAWIDLDKMELVHLEDTGVVPLPEPSGEYAAKYYEDRQREAPKPLEISQPEGPGFRIDGYHVEWMGWSFRVGFTAREGLVLHRIAYHDHEQNRPRSIIHRASLSEMVVPYGDPHINYARRNAFDVGEYGIGHLANSLTLGCDCLGVIHYFDAHTVTSRGEVVEIENAVCLHEEDYGILWKHTDWRTEACEVRRSRRLVVSSISTVGNYEYGFFWYFYLDGTIQFEIKLTGIINTGALAPGETRRYGTLVAPGLYGPIHQHIFNVRLDMALDGPDNSVYEVNTRAEPMGPDNPYGNAFYAEATQLKTEREARRTLDQRSARYWKITNPGVVNALGEPVAYKLMPGENAFPFIQPDSSVRRRAGFIDYHFWATAYHPRELYAAGDYPNQSSPEHAHGLAAYSEQNRPLDNTSLTVWYTMNSHHVVRPEDWPVMPVSYIGFQLKPVGFFDRNPALALPPRHSRQSCEV
jgi:primary-amine oxidase